jgi:drug/metabolite transporter (DMT)-like permease
VRSAGSSAAAPAGGRRARDYPGGGGAGGARLLRPAVAALVGLVLLGEPLAAREWVAVVCVIIASAGAALTGPAPGTRQDVPPPQ